VRRLECADRFQLEVADIEAIVAGGVTLGGPTGRPFHA
jgi:hypothetical protein